MTRYKIYTMKEEYFHSDNNFSTKQKQSKTKESAKRKCDINNQRLPKWYEAILGTHNI